MVTKSRIKNRSAVTNAALGSFVDVPKESVERTIKPTEIVEQNQIKEKSIDAVNANNTTKELKTRGVHILLKPSLYKKLEAFAKIKQVSVNDSINTIIENFEINF